MLNTKAQLGSYGLGILKDLLVACMIVLFVVMSSSLVTAGDEITRVSLSSLGVEGNGISESPAFSADGRYVAFSSAATNLVSGDTNGKWDVFVHDRQTGQTTRVSRSSAGIQGDHDSRDGVSLSADGRYVAFASRASNLATPNPQDISYNDDIFIHDRVTGQTVQASVTSTGEFGNGRSGNPSISDDGQVVAFRSTSTNFDATQGTLLWSIFVHNRTTGQTIRASKSNSGQFSNGDSLALDLSGNGQVVAFSSVSTNLVSGDTNGKKDIFVHDLLTGQTTRVSLSSAGPQGNGDSNDPTLSADGNLVAFSSYATNLVSNDTNIAQDIFLHDRTLGQTTRVSLPNTGGEADGPSTRPAISATGGSVAFDSLATNLVSGTPNGNSNVFALNRNASWTTLIASSGSGLGFPVISGDGLNIVFQSQATNLVSGDANGVQDIFVGIQSTSQRNHYDFDGNGKGDVVWRNTNTGGTTIWLMNGITVASTGSPGTVGLEWQLKGVGDLDGNGKADLVWRNSNTSSIAVWLMNGTSLASSGFPGNSGINWALQGVGDVNGDGKADLVYRDITNGATAIWLMNGTTISSSGFPGGVGLEWVINGVGDVNGDGKADLIWRNTNSGSVAIWLMNGTTVSSSGFPGSAGSTWAIKGVGDTNGDGKSDLIWQASSGSTAVWLMNGTTIASAGYPGGLGTDWAIQGLRDVDGNGKSDVLWRNTSTGATTVWLMNGTTVASSGSPGSIGLEWQHQPAN
ncbi:MAG: FG-GAP repeat protein [Nitrospira sp.]|nr:FG-GAP repeat protein [Nitrospira sp.]